LVQSLFWFDGDGKWERVKCGAVIAKARCEKDFYVTFFPPLDILQHLRHQN
jgi:hypothetical protein